MDLRRSHLPLVLLGPVVALLGGCPLTISEPNNPAHENALAEGERHMSHGRHEEAAVAFHEAAEEAHRRVDLDEAAYRETRALIAMEKYDEAVVILDRIGGRRPVARRTSRALFEAALLRLDHLNQREQALAGFERVMRETPDDGLGTRALYYILRDFEQRGDSAGAIAKCDELYGALGETSLGDDLLREKAKLLVLQGDRDGARVALEELIRRYPYPQGERWDDALAALAEMDVEDGQPARAIERLRTLVNRHEPTNLVGSYTLPSMPKAQIRIGEIYRDELRDYEAASDAFEEFDDEFPHSSMRDDALYQAGILWIDLGNDRSRGCRILRHVVSEFEVGSGRHRAEQRIESDCQDR